MLGYLCQPSEPLPTKLLYFTVMYRNNGHCQDLNSGLARLRMFQALYFFPFFLGGGGTVLVFCWGFFVFVFLCYSLFEN